MANSRHIPESVKVAVHQREGGRCRICGRVSEYMEYDHITPHRYGAPATVANIQLLCRACNLKKRDHADTCPTCLANDPSNPKAAWIPHDAVVCHRCNAQIAVRFANKATSKNEEGSWLVRRLRRMSFARRLVFVFAAGLLVWSIGTLAIAFISGAWSSFTGSFFGTRNVATTTGGSCSLVDASGRANLKSKCDSLDCDNDPSTVVGKVQAGSSVRTTGKIVRSSVPAAGEWMEIVYNGQTYYVASTKLSCQ